MSAPEHVERRAASRATWFRWPNVGVDGSKRLHYELCVATRAETPSTRLGALRGLARLYATLKDSALTHIPEAVPFVAELVEDGELEVRREALALMKTLEELAGDTLLH